MAKKQTTKKKAKKKNIEELKPYEIFVLNMKGLMTIQGITPEEMQEYMNVSKSTFYKRIREPYSMTMGEMASVAKKLGESPIAMIAKVMEVSEVIVGA